jgi:UPF0755 protein
VSRIERTDDDEYVVLSPPTPAGRRLLVVVAVVLGALAAVVALAVLWASRQIDPGGEAGARVERIEIPSGSSTERIASILEERDVITSASLFGYYVRWKGAGPWDAGEYVDFRRNSSFPEAIAVLDEGPVPPDVRLVRIPEGSTLAEAVETIAASVPGVTQQALLEALASGEVTSRYLPEGVTNWEGMLFPDSYQFADDATAAEILQTMATEMDEQLDALGYDRAEALQGRSASELVTAASLIEREAGSPPEERGQIARVIYNRLDAGEPLGIDASNLYGLGRTSGTLSRSDLQVDSPYNLRTSKGLPPTPIALPSRASLQAAIAPADGPWRWYVLVSNDPPTHLFTDSYREFQQAKADAQARGVF